MLVAESLQNRTAAHTSDAGRIWPYPRVAGDPPYRFAVIPTAWGLCGVVWAVRSNDAEPSFTFSEKRGDALLSRIVPPGLSCHELRKSLLKRHAYSHEVMGDAHGNFHPEVVPAWFPELVRYLQAYYANAMRDPCEPQHVDLWSLWSPRLEWSSRTSFQRKVLECVAGIPCGGSRTYGEIARQLGKPQASRAVGAALRSNPWPVLVPCHRVLGARGKLTGFTAPGGVAAKQRMLHMEAGVAGLFGGRPE